MIPTGSTKIGPALSWSPIACVDCGKIRFVDRHHLAGLAAGTRRNRCKSCTIKRRHMAKSDANGR